MTFFFSRVILYDILVSSNQEVAMGTEFLPEALAEFANMFLAIAVVLILYGSAR